MLLEMNDKNPLHLWKHSSVLAYSMKGASLLDCKIDVEQVLDRSVFVEVNVLASLFW